MEVKFVNTKILNVNLINFDTKEVVFSKEYNCLDPDTAGGEIEFPSNNKNFDKDYGKVVLQIVDDGNIIFEETKQEEIKLAQKGMRIFVPCNDIDKIMLNRYCANKRKEDVNMFKCSICGKEYEDAIDRAKCEIECDKRLKAEAEKKRQEELKNKKQERIEELNRARKEYQDSIKNATEVYNSTIKLAYEKYNAVENKFYKDYPSEDTYYVNDLRDLIKPFFSDGFFKW